MALYQVHIPIEGRIVINVRAESTQDAMNKAVKETLEYDQDMIRASIPSIDILTNKTGSFYAHKIED